MHYIIQQSCMSSGLVKGSSKTDITWYLKQKQMSQTAQIFLGGGEGEGEKHLKQ